MLSSSPHLPIDIPTIKGLVKPELDFLRDAIPVKPRRPGPALIAATKQVMKFAGRYLGLSSSSFQWAIFNSIVQKYCSSHSDLKIEKRGTKSIHQETASISDMVSKISRFILVAFEVSEALNIEELTATVESAFANLKNSSESGFATFNSSSNSSNNSFEYRIAFSFPHSLHPSKCRCLIVTIVLHANIQQESSWWGLSSSTTKDFSADVTGLQLEVTSGFKAPPSK